MKYLIIILLGGSIIAGSAFYMNRARVVKNPAPEVLSMSQRVEKSFEQEVVPRAPEREQPSAQATAKPASAQQSALAPVVSSNTNMDSLAVNRAVELLVSPQVSFEQKRAVWKQLRERGGLDGVIRGLEQRLAANQDKPEYSASLGEAYLQKCGMISDVREQGILAMQADKLFDAALNLDPANWEARFTKAVALSYWPASMDKGAEVIQHFTTLIQQQETQPPQPQFAESYVWLGDQYQKLGRTDDARAVWERGAALFPEADKIKTKLASSP